MICQKHLQMAFNSNGLKYNVEATNLFWFVTSIVHLVYQLTVLSPWLKILLTLLC